MRTIPTNQRGMGLISLMVALTIGSFLLAGLFQVWFQTRQTFSAQGQLALLQDNERMALTVVANTVQTGGYYPYYKNFISPVPSPAWTQTMAFPIGTPYTATGQFLYGTYSATPPGDTLVVRFVADTNTLDCLGQIDPAGSLVTNTYSVSAGSLQCSVSVNNSGTITTNSLPVVSGVANLSVLYNVATTVGSTTTYQYENASAVTNWGTVQSAEIMLQFNNPMYGQPGQTQEYMPVINRMVALSGANSSN